MTDSFLRNIERNAVVVVLYALLTARIVHQIIKDSHIDTGKILVNLKSTLWRVLVYPTFLIHGYSMLSIAHYCGTPGWAAFGRLASTCCT